MPRYGVFTEDDAKKVAAATRRVLAVPAVRNILKQPQQTIRQASFPATTATDDGFPDGDDGCSCEHCIAGVTLPDSGTLTTGQHCCTDHLRRTVVSPWSDAPGEHDLLYIGGNQWLTDPFDGPACESEAFANQGECETAGGTWTDPTCNIANEYRWMVTIDLTGTSYFELVLETDNGCDVPCIKYATSAIRCQCDWTFTLEHNDADFGGVSAGNLACNACVKPTINDELEEPPCANWCENNAVPAIYAVTLAGITDGTCDQCESWNRTWYLQYQDGPCVDFGGAGNCCWGAYKLPKCDETDVSFATIRLVGGALSFVMVDGGFTVTTYRDTLAENPTDCLATSVALPQDSVFSPSVCDDLPASVTVVPIFTGETSSPQTSGKCGTPCAAGNTPADPSTGGCCVDGFWYDYFDETECTAAGGVWNADEVAGAAACAERGACCMTFLSTASKVCFESISETLCDTLAALSEFNEDSYVWTEGETCAAACLPIGACCEFNPTSCSLTLEAACVGVWHESTTCAAADCDSTTGACCCGNGGCANAVPASQCDPGDCTSDCSFNGGCVEFHAGQDCTEVTCDSFPVGCCTDDSTILNCEDLTEAACLAAHPTGWTWTEGGTCDPGTPSCIVP